MHTFPDAIIDDHQGSERVSPPPAEKSIEDETNQDSTSKIGIDEGDMPLRRENGIAELLTRHSFSIGEAEHGNERSSQPCNAAYRGSRVRSCEQRHHNLRQT